MKRRSHRITPVIVLVCLMCVLLPLLVWLQYKWLGELSTAERERAESNLREAAANLSESFNSELAGIYFALQIDSSTLRARDWSRYSDRYSRWASSSPNKDLIERVLLAESRDVNDVRISVYDIQARNSSAIDWPAELSSLRDRLGQQKSGEEIDRAQLARLLVNPIFEQIPALVIPILDIQPSPAGQAVGAVYLKGYTVIELDLDYIRQEF